MTPRDPLQAILDEQAPLARSMAEGLLVDPGPENAERVCRALHDRAVRAVLRGIGCGAIEVPS